MSVDKVERVDDWIVDVVNGMEMLDIEEIDQINYKLQNICLSSNNNVDQLNSSSYESNDEKENGVVEYFSKGLNVNINNYNNKLITEELLSDIVENDDIERKDFSAYNIATSDNILEDIDREIHDNADDITAKYYDTIPDYGKVEYWDFQCHDLIIDKRLEPQNFHHHDFKPSYFKNNSKDFSFYFNLGCPNSSSDDDLKDHGIIRNDDIKENALQYRFSRIRKDGSKSMECICRMCSSKRWIPVNLFKEHMAIAHGIVSIENVGNIALPYPSALYRQSPGRLKCYYCKCPKCLNWIRLGLMSGVKNISETIRIEEKKFDNREIVGIYSNYYQHFMKCSLR